MAAFKPVVTGVDEPAGEWPFDHELLAASASAGQRPADVSPYRFGPPVSPHLAAQLTGASVDPAALLAAARAQAARAELLVVEGVGGLLVPLTSGYLVRDLAVDLGLEVVIAARPGLGTINHTLLTIECARAGGLEVVGVVLTPWPGDPGPIEATNRATIASIAQVRVSGLPPTRPAALAVAGAELPLDRWLVRSGALDSTAAGER